MSIPPNLEHVEAAEAEIQAKRQAMKATMTPTELARLEVIEECSAKLEAAGVPYELWAAHDDGKEGDGSRVHWWHFYKLSYVSRENLKSYTDRCFEAWKSMITQLLNYQTICGALTIVCHSLLTGKAISIHSRGEHQFIPPPPPDLPACDCQPPTV